MPLKTFMVMTALIAGDANAIAALKVPPGFVVERVAGPPLIERPMMAGFDERGRLFVCDSSGFNLLEGTSDDLVKDPPHLIRLIQDTDGDGDYDKSAVFADKMTFPMGALWHDGALYTASPPYVWRLEEDATTGRAAKREVFIAKFDFGGNSCDIHGPFLGPDGNLYWANCQRKFAIPRQEGGLLQGKAAGVFRIRPDGRHVEMLCAGGMDNPVEVAFSKEGEAFATVDLLIGYPKPRSDGIIHAIEGGVFPYQKLDRGFPLTGDVLPPMIDLGWVAPSGLMRYQDEAFGTEYQDNLFSAQFNTHRVVRHVIERDGATFRGRTEDFLVSDDPDFHPTDVLQDADGSLLVIDTGGWFVRGCPTSQIAKPQVTGAIYRVRRKEAPAVQDPRGLLIAWDSLAPPELVKLLDDPRWVVRDRAVHNLGRHGEKAVAALNEAIHKSDSIRARRNAVWAATRIEHPVARAAVRAAMTDSSDSVRLSAVNSAGWWRDAGVQDVLKKLAVADDMPAVRREAATALGRIGRAEAVPAVLNAMHNGGDRFLEHAQIYALIRIADRAATLPGLRDSDPRVRRAALLALDQMEHGELTRELVIPLLDSPDADLQRTALTIAMARPEWADAVAELLNRWLADPQLTENNRAILQTALVSLSGQPAIQIVADQALGRDSTPLSSRLLLLDVIAQASVEKLPSTWAATLQKMLAHADERLRQQAVATVQTRNETAFDDVLLSLSRDVHVSTNLRLAALEAVAPRLNPLEPSLFEFVRGQLDIEQPVLTRLAAASALSQMALDEQQLIDLTTAVTKAGAVELPYLLSAFEQSQSVAVGRELIQSLERSPGLDGLSPDAVRRTLKAFPEEVQTVSSALLQKLSGGLEQQSVRLAELEPALSGGNPIYGRILFFGTKASCAACHAVAGQGTNIGPDLSKIGAIRTPRDLLESIVFPSISLVRSYESYSVATEAGRVHVGLMKRSTAEAVTLITTERKEIRLPRTEIEEIQPSRVSIMPKGLDTQLTQQELSNLIAYLASLK